MNPIRFSRPSKLLTCAALLLALGGCASGVPGLSNGPDADVKYSRGYVSSNLIKGKTTSAQVKQKFGAPVEAHENFEGGKTYTYWSYARNREGLGGLMDLAHKYAPVDTSLAMYSASSQVSSATGAVNDAGNVTGTNTADQRTTFTNISVEFIDGVLNNYRLY